MKNCGYITALSVVKHCSLIIGMKLTNTYIEKYHYNRLDI
ncbi:hypothetical protein RINTU1_18510 [Candidatus Regiella insecticola]|uniref:Uncharacterized protein n=1 Tax=Candidatus Regiella insecticola TaxID=138073 RepID=A0A6L2ZPL1_9ENTR|nr:hypothetical protein RINTU1_18510 [Candidatus Regiella insecticola]